MKHLNIRWLLSLFLITTLTLQSWSQEQTYLTEGFEGTTFPPTGWNVFHNGGGNDWQRQTSSSGVSEGSASMSYRWNSSNAADAWAFASGISLEQGDVIEIFFDYKASSSYSEKLQVAIGTTNNTSEGLTSLWDQTLNNSSFITKRLEYEVPVTGTYYVAWNCHSDADKYYLYVDNIIIKERPSCYKPTGLEVSKVDNNSALVDWNKSIDNESQSTVEYGEAGFTLGTGTQVVVDDTTGVVISGLSASTDYEAYVRADCSDTEHSEWIGPIAFSTACDPIDDFSENIQTANVPALPDCWNVLVDGSSKYVKTVEEGNNKYVEIKGSTSSYGAAAFISPIINNLKANTSTKRMTFKLNNKSAECYFGVMSDRGDQETFTKLLEIPSSSQDAFLYHEVLFTEEQIALIEDDDKYFAFTTPDYSGIIKVDDIVWEDLPTCMHPTNTKIIDISHNTATLKWENLTSVDHWDVKVIKDGQAMADAISFENIDANPFVATGLQPQDTFRFVVRARCTANDISEWTQPSITFITECEPQAAIYTQDFNAQEEGTLPECWSFVRNSSASSAANAKVVANKGFDNTNAVDIYNSSTTSNNAKILLVSPPLEHLTDNTYQLRIMIKNNANLSIGTMLHKDSLSSFHSVMNIDAQTNAEYVERVITFENIPEEHKYIAFRHIGTEDYKHIYLDNFIWEPIPACPMPLGLEQTDANGNSVSLVWTASEGAASYELDYAVEGTDLDGTPEVEGITDVNTIVSSLQSQTFYTVSLRARCSDTEVSDWSTPISVRTGCSSFEDILKTTFEGVEKPNLPECWSKIIFGPSGNTMAVKTLGSSNQRVVLDNKTFASPVLGLGLVSPELSNLQAGTHILRFKIENKNIALGIGVMSDLENLSTYVALDTIPAASNSLVRDTSIVLNTANITADHKYIVFRHTMTSANKKIYLDNISWRENTGCAYATGFEVSAIGYTEATISWNPKDGATFDVEVVPAGTDFTGTATQTAITDTFFVATNLSIGTAYKYQVKTHCSSTSVSLWESAEAGFQTKKIGSDCTMPKEVVLTDNVYEDLAQTTGGMLDSVNGTFLNNYDNGPDVLYRLTVAQKAVYNFTLDPKTTKYSSLSVFSGCPNADNGMVHTALNSSATVRKIEDYVLEQGTYFVVVDTWSPNPDSITEYDLTIEKVACPKPFNLSVANVLNNTATLEWEYVDNTNWDIKYALSSEGEPTDVSVNDVTEIPYTLSGLQPDSEYKVWLRADCGSNDIDTTDWVGPVTFTTYPDCPLPTGVELMPFTDRLEVSWNGYFATHWDIVVGEEGFVFDENTPITLNDVANAEATISNLQAGTNYSLYLRADCGQNNIDTTVWKGPFNFTTLQAEGDACYHPIEINFPADFTNDRYEANNQSTTNTGNNESYTCLYSYDDGNDIFYKFNVTQAGLFDIIVDPGPTTKTAVLLTSTCDSLNNCIAKHTESTSDPHGIAMQYLEEGEYLIMVDKSRASNSNADIPNFQLAIEYYACPDPTNVEFTDTTTTSFTLDWWDLNAGTYDIAVLHHPSEAPATGTETAFTDKPKVVSGLLPAHTYDVYLKANCTSDSSSFAGPFTMTTKTACDKVMGLETGDITASTVMLKWDKIEGASYEIAISSEDDFVPDGFGSYIAVNDTFKLVNGLESSTNYKVYVRSICGGNNYGMWSSSTSFVTDCDAFVDLDENFNNFLPDCWKKRQGVLAETVNFTSSTSIWSSDTYLNVLDTSSHCAKLNIYGDDRYNWLITPPIDLGSGTPKQLEFDLGLTKYNNTIPVSGECLDDKFAVVISTDGGLTWSSANTLRLWDNQGSPNVYNNISNQGEHIIIYLEDYTGLVKIGFYGESSISLTGDDNDLFIDNVKISDAPSCLTPSSLNTQDLTNSSVNLDFEGIENGTWDIKWVEVAEDPDETVEPTEPMANNVTTKPYLIDNLTAETTYRVWVRTDCTPTENNTNVSPWSTPIEFTTYSACPAPTNVQVEAPSTTADIQWDGFFVDNWDIAYGEDGFTPSATPTIDDIADTEYTIQDLEPNTEYDLYLRADCGQNNVDTSVWVGPFNFTTGCGVYTSLNENFNHFLPTCWENKNGLLEETTNLVSGSSWMSKPYLNSTDTSLHSAKVNIWGASKKAWLITPLIDLGSGTIKQLEFDLGLTKYGDTIPASGTCTDDKFAVVISTDGGETWSSANTLRLWDNQGSPYVYNNISNDGEHIAIYLQGYTGLVKIAFYGESTVGSNGDNDLFIDNVKISDAPSCLPVILSEVEAITSSGATIKWNTMASQSQWEVQYGEVGFDIENNAGQTLTVDDSSQVLTGLSSNTMYDVYVRAVCSADESSPWESISFRTLNDSTDFISFTHANQVTPATIDLENHTIALTVGFGTELLYFAPSFEVSEGASVKIGTQEQVSGTSIVDFSNPVTYTITAEDGVTTQNWVVTVTEAPVATETDFLTFSMEEQTGDAVIDATAHTIAVEVNWLANLTNLKPTFTLSYGAIAKVDGLTQTSGTSANDFTNPVTYQITAEDGTTTQDWVVTVTQGAVPQGALCSDPIPLTLDAQDISGTTEGFGDDYDDSVMEDVSTYYLGGDDIVYEFTIPEDGTISGSATYSHTWGAMVILDGCPDQASTQSVVISGSSTSTSASFSNVDIEAGTYYLIISNWVSPQSVDFVFNLSYEETLSDSAEILTFNIPGQVGETQILSEDKKVKVVMPYGTDLSNLVADFTISAEANVTVAGVQQVSGTTANNWAEVANGYINYLVQAEDGTTKNWKVYVTTVPNTENDILTYSIPEQVSSEINTDERKVTVVMPAGNNLVDLVPEFTLSDEATAKVAGVLQESGVTTQSWNTVDFKEYVVSAGNGDAQTWKVYVENAPNSAAEIEEFKLIPGIQIGTTEINSEEAKILVEVSEQADMTDLIIFKLTASEGATVTYQGNEVVPQSTSIDLSESVILVVTAEDGTIKEWEVTRKGSVPLISASEFSVYPNPTTGVLNISSDIDKAEWLSIEVISTSGQIVKRIAQKDINNAIDLSEQANGLYLIKVHTTKGNVVKKVNLIK